MNPEIQALTERVHQLETLLSRLITTNSKSIMLDRTIVIKDTANIQLATGTGTKIGTSASQKLGFFNATPVAQQLKTNHNNWAAVSDVVSALVSLGLFDQT